MGDEFGWLPDGVELLESFRSQTQEKDVADEDEPIGIMDRATAGYDLADEDVDFDVNDDFDCVTDKADTLVGIHAIMMVVPPSP